MKEVNVGDTEKNNRAILQEMMKEDISNLDYERVKGILAALSDDNYKFE